VVSDAAHRVIARSEQEEAFIGKELPPTRWHREVVGGAFEFIDSQGQPSLEASATSELTRWHTAIWAPKALLEAPVRAQRRTLGVMALLAIALVVASALWLGGILRTQSVLRLGLQQIRERATRRGPPERPSPKSTR
jgi:hypothetical protein